jgi:hypothetical protein
MTWISTDNTLQISITLNGITHTITRRLPESAIKSNGPMSLESGVMGLVRELCQEIYNEMREAV